MATFTLDRKELEKHIGKITPNMIEKISMMGTPVEDFNEETISVDITPNRPDFLSMQGFIRGVQSFLGKKPGLKEYKVEKPEKNYSVTIDKSVKRVRPFIACAIVKNLRFTDEKIKEIIDIQEKLHTGYGRNRKKMAIGIYPLEAITLPIKYYAEKPEEIKFQPLEFPREINGRQILSQHPTGREYGHLLQDAEIFPIFEDAKGEILSMPPIINSHKTGKIDENTKEVFIEVSGFNLEFQKKAINMIVTALADMGGKVYAMEIFESGKKELSPNLEPEKMHFSIENVNKVIGINLNEKEIKENLEKMGLGYGKEKNQCFALIPSYRTDILHEVDIIEDIAIAYGYENLVPEIPKISTIGEENAISIRKRKIAEILIGLGLIEISTYHLSTKEKQFKNIGVKEFLDETIEVIDSKTENNILRASLLANSIAVLSENLDSAYPQKIFELGRIFFNDNKSETGIGEKEKLCVSLCHEKANFTEIKQVLDYLAKMLNLKYEIEEFSHPSFIEGRCGEIIINNQSAGFLGEIHPFVLKNNKIMMPVSSLELDINQLFQ
ncbi:MAG: phenylalanine--tRNA ligase subunit beta [Candidatus Nanoarchaeia archaeon]|nr:phenylalanine--tRNA ligase subunit beta [Candidatus Nanoarchaeia archaeon]